MKKTRLEYDLLGEQELQTDRHPDFPLPAPYEITGVHKKTADLNNQELGLLEGQRGIAMGGRGGHKIFLPLIVEHLCVITGVKSG